MGDFYGLQLIFHILIGSLMANKFNTDATLTPQILGKQLKQPEGSLGKQIGKEMNKGNRYICLNSYQVLDPKEGNRILEIGMGNGFFVSELLEMAAELRYWGVDFSAVMVEEAIIINQHFIDSGSVHIQKASIASLPYASGSFDCITTTNTLYFWPNPQEDVLELIRVLEPGGKLLVGYRSKQCMDQLELTKHGFEKYEVEAVEQLLRGAGLQQVSTQRIKEPMLEVDGTTLAMEGIFTTAVKPISEGN